MRENLGQFLLLVFVNGLVGSMIGLERTLLPEIGVKEFQLDGNTAILSFIIVFGVSKAITNYYTGRWADRLGRKKLLIIGWVVGLFVPILLSFSTSWSLILFANVLLGINQGLTWSSTVVMKIDLVGEKNRGLAIGLNESIGYLAVGVVAYLSSWVAQKYGLRPYPFYLGIGFAITGLTVSWLFVKDTLHHVTAEGSMSQTPLQKSVFIETSWKNPSLGAISQAGLINNLNDGMVWGILPLYLASKGFDLLEIGKLVAIYPTVWGLGQLVSGKLIDHLNKKGMLVIGMALQGLALVTLVYSTTFLHFSMVSVVLGLGTAIVYPTFLAVMADKTHPSQRGESIGVFRLWRDLGYAVGAFTTGIVADLINLPASILFIAILTLFSAFVLQVRLEK